MSQVVVQVTVDFVQIGAGQGGVMLGAQQANHPGQGQSEQPITVGNAQTLRLSVAEAVPGTAGSITVANILTALQSAATDLAGSTGTPIITATTLATINGWQTGNP